MFCTRCGNQNYAEDKFCSRCGAPTEHAKPSESINVALLEPVSPVMTSSVAGVSGGWPSPRVTMAVTTYRRVTSLVFYTLRSPRKVTGDEAFHRAAYRQAQIWTALLGWWGFPFGIVWSIMSLVQNKENLNAALSILHSGLPSASWRPDPSGVYQERYWDGSRWTDQVRSATTDMR
jgi:Protein of unknown function (DUF2510)/zinc-ribbon domain